MNKKCLTCKKSKSINSFYKNKTGFLSYCKICHNSKMSARTKKLYKEILLILDTCEAFSLFDNVEAPGLIMVGTSTWKEHAYSHQPDP